MTDYYAFYNLPEQYHLNTAELKQRYRQKSRELHPDYHTQADADTQADMLQQSSINNDAYKTLSHPQRRLQYLLQRYGLLDENGGTTGNAQLDPMFLMEMMELNEAIEEGSNTPQLQNQVDTLEAEINETLDSTLRRFDKADEKEAILNEVLQPYLQQKYVLRIREALRTFAP